MTVQNKRNRSVNLSKNSSNGLTQNKSTHHIFSQFSVFSSDFFLKNSRPSILFYFIIEDNFLLVLRHSISRREVAKSFSRHNSCLFSCYDVSLVRFTGIESGGQWSLSINEKKFLTPHSADFSWMWVFAPSCSKA